MEKRLEKLHRSNEGFSFMELIVTLLISSVVTAAVVGFLAMGLNYYRRTNAETALQTESQVAELFLTELLQESDGYRVITNRPTGVDYALEVTRDSKIYIVAKKGTILVYGEVDMSTNPDDEARVYAITSQTLDKVFLAKHVSGFNVSPGNHADAISTNNGLIRLGLEFSTEGKTYTGDQTVSIRNTEKN